MEQFSLLEARQSVDAWSQLTPEQRTKAGLASEALANKFDLDYHDIGLIMVKNDTGEHKPVVMLIAGNGLFKGNWNEIMFRTWLDTDYQLPYKANRGQYVVKVGGQKIDTRKGMTKEVYTAFIDSRRGIDLSLADSEELADRNGDAWTRTLLTGEFEEIDEHNAHFVPIGYVKNGAAYIGEQSLYKFGSPVTDDRMRFRPAIVIE